jgi:hypothetical protein
MLLIFSKGCDVHNIMIDCLPWAIVKTRMIMIIYIVM